MPPRKIALPRWKVRRADSAWLCHFPVRNVVYPCPANASGQVGWPSRSSLMRNSVRPVSSMAREGTQTAPWSEPMQ